MEKQFKIFARKKVEFVSSQKTPGKGLLPKFFLLLLAALIIVSAAPRAEEEGGAPVIRNSPLSPKGTGDGVERSSSEAPAEVPRWSDVGDISAFSGLVREGLEALARWDLAKADKIAEQLKTQGKENDQASLVFLYKLAFFHGDYKQALSVFDKLAVSSQDPEVVKMRERLKNLARTMEGALTFESEHFIVRVTPGPDEILAKDALRTLEAAYSALTQDLKVKPTSKVVTEIFPTFKSFNWATGLSEKDVENSGTVAVCKFARLMITTPRALVFGYTWRDTLSHEFVHYLLFLRAGYNIPIWLHEGIAKYQETRWRMPAGGYLSPIHQSILASALAKGELITFEQMEPSFALLPTPTHGALAFAEVSCAVRYLVERGGFELVNSIIDRLAQKPDYKAAIRQALGEPFESFHRKWITYMKTLPLEHIEGIEWVGVKVKTGETQSEEYDESFMSKKDSQLYKYTRLGDLLREQGRHKAALIEYKKALELAPNSVSLLNKTALMYILSGDVDSAEPLLKKADKLSPMVFPYTYKRLGMVYIQRKDWQTARKYLEMSADINPFDPQLQMLLLKVYQELGEKELEAETQEKIAILSKPASPSVGR